MSLKYTIKTTLIASGLALVLFNAASHARTDCNPPLVPVIPEAETASKEEILTALKTIKDDFQPAIVNFQNCIATEKAAIGDVATDDQNQEWDQLFDAAYALETQVAEKMNAVIRAYKAREAGDEDKKSND